jgi:hypothetical protein
MAVAMAWSGAALAQGSGNAPAAESAASYSNKELKAFAVAVLMVQDLNVKMLDKVARAQTPEEKTIARSEARQQMMKAVREEGLSVSKYNRINMEVRTNPELADKVKRYMERAQ